MRNISYIDDFHSWKEEFIFSIDINIRFSETDMFGHMNNISAFIYFEEARIEFLKSKGFTTDIMDKKLIPVVSDLQCDYHDQIFFDEQIKLFVKVNSVGNSSIDIHYLGLKNDGKVCLTGRGNLVNINLKTGQPVPLTNEQKQKFLQK